MSYTSRPDDVAMVERMRRHRLQGLSEMACGMAHEINQPLSGIRGFAEGILIGMEEGWDITQEEIMAKMRRIISESDRIDELIQSIRNFSDENSRLDLLAVDLHLVVMTAVRLLGSRLRMHGTMVQVVGDHPHGVWVHANPFALQEAVQILLINAGDACRAQTHQKEKVDGVVTVTVVADASDCAGLISVSDNGIGMAGDTLSQAGEPFFTTKGPDRGTGLGLAVVHGIMKQCGGQLSLISTPGEGTTALLRLWHAARP